MDSFLDVASSVKDVTNRQLSLAQKIKLNH